MTLSYRKHAQLKLMLNVYNPVLAKEMRAMEKSEPDLGVNIVDNLLNGDD